MSEKEHRQRAPASVAAYVVTLSDTRDENSDTSGATIREALQAAGHTIVGSCILPENPATLRHDIQHLLELDDPQVLVFSGGTGIAPRDLSFQTLSRIYDSAIPGFGELFRFLSYQEIGSAALLSRASAGIARGKLLFSIPGSSAAVRLALDKLILPELGHMVGELRRERGPERDR